MGGVIDQLEPLFDEIATLLGELEGVERCWELLGAQEGQKLPDGWMHDVGWFKIPGSHGWETSALYVAMAPAHPDWDSSPVSNADRQQMLQNALDEVWQESRDQWARSAVPSVYRSVTRNVWEPDPEPVAESARELGRVARWLADQVGPRSGWRSPDDPSAPRWLVELAEHWPPTSASSESFFAFWDDVNDKCGLYVNAAARLAAGTAQSAATISDFQTNLVEVATKARDQVLLALQQWQVWKQPHGAWPTGEIVDSSASDILGGVSYASGVVSLFPPAAAVAGPLGVVTGGLAYLVPDKVHVMEVRSALTASQIHNSFLDDLRLVADHLLEALDGVRSEPQDDGSAFGHQSLQQYAADVVANHHDWSPPPVDVS